MRVRVRVRVAVHVFPVINRQPHERGEACSTQGKCAKKQHDGGRVPCDEAGRMIENHDHGENGSPGKKDLESTLTADAQNVTNKPLREAAAADQVQCESKGG